MAVVDGTNAGFVTVAPVADPTGNFTQTCDNAGFAGKFTTPAGISKITEVGWWCSNATQAANFRIALYSHDAGGDDPDARLYVTDYTAKGTASGWKTVSGLDWDVNPETVYWLALYVQNTATATQLDAQIGSGRYSYNGGDCPDPWPNVGEYASVLAIYGVVESGTTYSELSGTIATTSTTSGNLELLQYSALSGTIAAESNVESASLGQTKVSLPESCITKRVIAIGNSRFFYEDI